MNAHDVIQARAGLGDLLDALEHAWSLSCDVLALPDDVKWVIYKIGETVDRQRPGLLDREAIRRGFTLDPQADPPHEPGSLFGGAV